MSATRGHDDNTKHLGRSTIRATNCNIVIASHFFILYALSAGGYFSATFGWGSKWCWSSFMSQEQIIWRTDNFSFNFGVEFEITLAEAALNLHWGGWSSRHLRRPRRNRPAPRALLVPPPPPEQPSQHWRSPPRAVSSARQTDRT